MFKKKSHETWKNDMTIFGMAHLMASGTSSFKEALKNIEMKFAFDLNLVNVDDEENV